MLPKSLLFLLLASLIDADRYISDAKSFAPQPCPKPKLYNGKVRVRQRSSRLVKFMCSPRYTLIGNRYATCRNGKWDVPIPVCVRAGCDDLPFVPNSLHIKEQQDAWRIYFCLPGFKMEGSSAIFCDGYRWNATAPACIDEASSKPSLSCDFEDPNLCGWTQDELHDFDWQRWKQKTPSSFVFTGPSYDHTHGENGSGYYMLIESTAEAVNSTARLLSPVYDKSLTAEGCFRFYYHMFGRTIGGLRVYQKPASVPLFSLLNAAPGAPSYLLFERFGETGDAWYSAAPGLTRLDEDFQIVIEGIRGSSYMSDIAVDDVSVLQGQECDRARLEAETVTPNPEVLAQTCANRCDRVGSIPGQCSCSSNCILSGGCCPDFFDLCIYGPSDSLTTDDDDALPETQKLVGETTTTIKQPTNVTTTQATTTTTKPTTTVKTTPITTTPKPIIKTTSKSTTIKQTPSTTKATTPKPTPTTAKPTPTTTKPTTTTKQTKSTSKPTTSTSKPTTSTSKPTTAKATTTTAKTTEVKLATKITTTSLDVVDESIIEKRKHETEDDLNRKGMEALKKKGDSIPTTSWNTAIITIVVLSIGISVILLGLHSRTARGRQAWARLRGRTRRDPEVTYLNAAVDDDL